MNFVFEPSHKIAHKQIQRTIILFVDRKKILIKIKIKQLRIDGINTIRF